MRFPRKSSSDRTTLRSQGTEGTSGSGTSFAITIVYHPNLDRVGDRVLLSDLTTRRSFALSRIEPLFATPGQTGGEPLGDEHVSRRPLYLEALDNGGIRLDVGESGTAVMVRGQQVCSKISFSAKQVRRGVVLELGRRVVLLLHTVGSIWKVLGDAFPPGAAHNLVGHSDGLQRVLLDIHNVADLSLPVLLRGENGTGKELVASAIHQASPRRRQPFVSVNLGAIPPSLAVAQLFGAERGTYTSSVRRQAGYFEQARGGTLFLDEIGEAPSEIQALLLRVLETGEIQTIGARTHKIDVRIIAATDADLEARVASGTFGPALLHRLSTYPIRIPPLRERRDDIGRLFVKFLREQANATGQSNRLVPAEPEGRPWVPSSLVARLADYDWPGNVRQLRNVVQQLVVGNRGRDRIKMPPSVEDLLVEGPGDEPNPGPPEELPQPSPALRSSLLQAGALASVPGRRRPGDVSESELRAALRAVRREPSKAATLLGIARASIYLLMGRYGIRTAADLSPQEINRSYHTHGGDVERVAEALEVSPRALRRRLRKLKLS